MIMITQDIVKHHTILSKNVFCKEKRRTKRQHSPTQKTQIQQLHEDAIYPMLSNTTENTHNTHSQETTSHVINHSHWRTAQLLKHVRYVVLKCVITCHHERKTISDCKTATNIISYHHLIRRHIITSDVKSSDVITCHFTITWHTYLWARWNCSGGYTPLW